MGRVFHLGGAHRAHGQRPAVCSQEAVNARRQPREEMATGGLPSRWSWLAAPPGATVELALEVMSPFSRSGRPGQPPVSCTTGPVCFRDGVPRNTHNCTETDIQKGRPPRGHRVSEIRIQHDSWNLALEFSGFVYHFTSEVTVFVFYHL